ncbi:hypothetical protein [Polyangium spumosum]|uniref:hypothetical protein n=1 Tax=Polyangium spumosum TaxID=889282 RepID=UPI001479236C|nr:hypothetical protein [Polyangium spumosum]
MRASRTAVVAATAATGTPYLAKRPFRVAARGGAKRALACAADQAVEPGRDEYDISLGT